MGDVVATIVVNSRVLSFNPILIVELLAIMLVYELVPRRSGA